MKIETLIEKYTMNVFAKNIFFFFEFRIRNFITLCKDTEPWSVV